MWTNRQFWLDSTWRAFRTFCQTLAALLAAQFSGLLQATGQNVGAIPHTPWLGFLYASAIAALISLLQSVDRERAVAGTTVTTASSNYSDPVDAAPNTAPLLTYSDNTPATLYTQPGCGESLR